MDHTGQGSGEGYGHAMKTRCGEHFLSPSPASKRITGTTRSRSLAFLVTSWHLEWHQEAGRGAAAMFRGCLISSPAPTFHGCCSLPTFQISLSSPEKDTHTPRYTVKFWESVVFVKLTQSKTNPSRCSDPLGRHCDREQRVKSPGVHQ